MKIFEFDKDDMRQDVKEKHRVDKFFDYMKKPCFRKLKNYDFPESNNQDLNNYRLLQVRNVVFNWIMSMSNCRDCYNDFDPQVIQLLGFDRVFYFYRNKIKATFSSMTDERLRYEIMLDDFEVTHALPTSFDLGDDIYIIVLSRCLWCRTTVYSSACLDVNDNIEKLSNIVNKYRNSSKPFAGFYSVN